MQDREKGRDKVGIGSWEELKGRQAQNWKGPSLKCLGMGWVNWLMTSGIWLMMAIGSAEIAIAKWCVT